VLVEDVVEFAGRLRALMLLLLGPTFLFLGPFDSYVDVAIALGIR